MNNERRTPDHEGDAFFDRNMYEVEPHKKREPKEGSPEWRAALRERLARNENNNDYSKANAIKKRDELPKPIGEEAEEAAKKRRSTIAKYGTLTRPPEEMPEEK